MQLGAQRARRVVLVVERVAQQEQAALLGAQQEDQPHHHRQAGLVQDALAHALQQRPAAVLVGAIQRRHEDLDRAAHLVAELVGDLLLIHRAGIQQRLQRLVIGHAEEAPDAQQAAERAQRQPLLAPQARVPGDVAGGLARPGAHQQPRLAVGRQPQAHARLAQQLHHARGGVRLPGAVGQGFVERLAGGVNLDQQAGLARARRDQHRVWPQRLTVLRQGRLDALRDALPFGQQLVGQLQRLPQHVADPGGVDGGIRREAALVVGPFLVGRAQFARVGRIVRVQPLREGAHQHRHREERAGDFEEREPFGVVAGDGHDQGSFGLGDHAGESPPAWIRRGFSDPSMLAT